MPRLISFASLLLGLSLLLGGCAPEPAEPAQPAAHPWRHEAPDGSIHLWTVDHMHVMNMVAWCLQQQRYDLLIDEVIAEQTKTEYRSLGRDPLEAVQWMVQNEADINRLFSLLRASRGRVENAGYKRVRLTLYGPLKYELPITQMEVVMENRVWKLAVIR
ncbi:MAG: hypothetical protein ACF8NJ_09680 [Phycisphaerales bacterium JB038]